MVITRTTRNRFALTGTWVRIPPSPYYMNKMTLKKALQDRKAFFNVNFEILLLNKEKTVKVVSTYSWLVFHNLLIGMSLTVSLPLLFHIIASIIFFNNKPIIFCELFYSMFIFFIKKL